MRQTDALWVMADRGKERVAASIFSRARTVAWANLARISQGRAKTAQEVSMKPQEPCFAGIDVAKAYIDVAVRPGGPNIPDPLR